MKTQLYSANHEPIRSAQMVHKDIRLHCQMEKNIKIDFLHMENTGENPAGPRTCPPGYALRTDINNLLNTNHYVCTVYTDT